MDIDDQGHVQQILTTNCETPNFAFTLQIMYLGLSVYIFKQIFFQAIFFETCQNAFGTKIQNQIFGLSKIAQAIVF